MNIKLGAIGKIPIKKIQELFEILLIASAITLGFFLVFWPLRIEGSSMQDTFDSNDLIIVSRVVSWFSIGRGDIVLCRFQVDDEDTQIIKRVIGVPNEHLKISGGKVYINGELLWEDYKKYAETYGDIEIYLNNNEYFVMGDNRRLSQDSRQLGVVRKRDISAKALFRFPSFTEKIIANTP